MHDAALRGLSLLPHLDVVLGGVEQHRHVPAGQADVPQLLNYKYGTPKEVLEFTLDTYHTPYYAAGYLMKEINPRVGVICHYSEESAGESISEIRDVRGTAFVMKKGTWALAS